MRIIIFRSPGKPCLVKYFKWLLKVIQGQRAVEGHFRCPKGTVPSLEPSKNTGVVLCPVWAMET